MQHKRNIKKNQSFLKFICKKCFNRNVIIKKYIFQKKHKNALFYINSLSLKEIKIFQKFINKKTNIFKKFEFKKKFKNLFVFNIQFKNKIIDVKWNKKIKNYDTIQLKNNIEIFSSDIKPKFNQQQFVQYTY